MAGEAAIQIRDLVKTYGDFQALKGISFDVRQGEILGLLGPNGAGKSTTMKILTSYISATSGAVTVDGLDLFREPIETRRRIGYLPESTALYTDMVVYDYLVYCGEMRGFSRKQCDERIEALAHRVGIVEKLTASIGTLSKGYKQRVGLAQALLHNPKIVILDEPTSGLDPNQIVEIRELIRELGKDHTVILSTHILPEVRQTCDRVVIVHRGEVVADGSIEELEGKMASEHELVVGLAPKAGEGPELLRGALAGLDGVRRCAVAFSADLPVPHVTLQLSASRDLRPEIAKWALSTDHPLVELRRKSMDLEGIFQHLTADR
jgi:ABC-2 type transport system ATP-binding protein